MSPSNNIYELDKVHVSKYIGEQLDFLINSVLSMRPQLHITGATANTTIKASGTDTQNEYSKIADNAGECTIFINRYGNYDIYEGSTKKDEIVIDEYKIYEVSLS